MRLRLEIRSTIATLVYAGIMVYETLFVRDPRELAVSIVMSAFLPVSTLGAALGALGEKRGSTRLAKTGKALWLVFLPLALVAATVWRFVICG